MIHATSGKLHWNYFLALERDLEAASRYIEFCPDNFKTYSIELAHLLFAASSEVDVIAKSLCEILSHESPRGNINDYRAVLMERLPQITTLQTFLPRYGLSLTPWDNWGNERNPAWWSSYNNVKHERDQYFQEATLKNALNALGALLILTLLYYSYTLSEDPGTPLPHKETTFALGSQSNLMRLHEDSYYSNFVV